MAFLVSFCVGLVWGHLTASLFFNTERTTVMDYFFVVAIQLPFFAILFGLVKIV